jgi:hypothetical protein
VLKAVKAMQFAKAKLGKERSYYSGEIIYWTEADSVANCSNVFLIQLISV